MAIVIQTFDTFDIEDRDGLIAYIIAKLELDAESAAQVPTFIRMGEYRLNRLLTAPERETSVTLTTEAGQQAVALPVDYRQLRNARLVGTDGWPLDQVSPEALHTNYTNASGRPVAYSISEQSLQLGPVPDGEYEVRLVYSARIPPLTEAAPTNWLLVSNADAYVYSALWQACAWLEDVDAAIAFRNELFTIIDEINLSSSRYRNGAPLVPRVVGLP